MPKHAHLAEELRCPDCHAAVVDLAWFQWGYCANYSVVDEYVYRVGDAIRWATADDGSTPAWTYFEIDNHGGNLGDPSVTDLVVKEVAELYWVEEPVARAVSCRRRTRTDRPARSARPAPGTSSEGRCS